MSRSFSSSFAPMVVTCCSLVFAVGAGYAWWTDQRGLAAPPPTSARAAVPPPIVPAADAASAPSGRPASTLRKCLGRDGVPVFTSGACPAGTALQREIAIEVPMQEPAHSNPPPAVPPVVAAASANATVVLPAPTYGIPDRGYRRDLERERAWDRCEHGKVRARAELAALRNRRTMSHIRKWEAYAMRECAPYQVMSR